MSQSPQSSLIQNSFRIARMAVPVPLSGLFDYLIPEQTELAVGCRIRVTFGRRTVVGILCEIRGHSDYDINKLKLIDEVLDPVPLISPDLMELAERASRYYHHPIGEVYATLLPNALAQGRLPDDAEQPLWQLTDAGQIDGETFKRAPKQLAILSFLNEMAASGHKSCDADMLNHAFEQWRPAMKALVEKSYVETLSLPPAIELVCHPGLLMSDEQKTAVETVERCEGFGAFLVNGITGSGKTEVYLQLVKSCLENNKQALILVPEIGLTPQLVQRFNARFETLIVSLHSNMTDLERLRAWRLAAEGRARVVIGTRSALFTSMPELGLILVDEEHDGSFKQQDSFRYHARDLAVMRAQLLDIPIIMGSATPSLESLYNISEGRYTELKLTKRAGNAKPPRIAVIDNRRNFDSALSPPLRAALGKHLEQGNQVLLFLNRRGYAPMLSCPGCGWHAQCMRCDANLTLHYKPNRLCCHHCTSEQPVNKTCPNCNYSELDTVGLGTEKLEQELQALYPDYQTIRIDRDSTRRKGSLEQQLNKIQAGEAQILLGTQMLAKGHHFPRVTLVGVLDCDRGLFSTDFRGPEHMGQLILQVAGRAGREERPGEVLIQSTQTENPLLHSLVTESYGHFSTLLLDERRQALLPPFCHFALLRAESVQQSQAMSFLSNAASQLPTPDEVAVLGPIPAPMERRAGRFRAQLLVQSNNRRALHPLLHQLRMYCESSKNSRSVRWSLDIDPTDMF